MLQIIDIDDVLGFEAPTLPCGPSFTLPDRNRGLECVDTEAGRGKRVGTVRRRCHNHHRAIANHELANAVNHDESTDRRPANAGIGGEGGQTRRYLRFIGLVLESVDVLAIATVIASDTGKQHNGAAIGAMSPLERLNDREGVRRQSNPVIASFRSLHKAKARPEGGGRDM